LTQIIFFATESAERHRGGFGGATHLADKSFGLCSKRVFVPARKAFSLRTYVRPKLRGIAFVLREGIGLMGLMGLMGGELRMQNLELRNQRCKPRKTRINTDFLTLKTQEVQETQGGEKRSKGKKQRQP